MPMRQIGRVRPNAHGHGIADPNSGRNGGSMPDDSPAALDARHE
jgi:hypothetical protein